MRNHDVIETAVLAAISLAFAAAMFVVSTAAENERTTSQTDREPTRVTSDR